jgi:hypothetical protein
MNVQLSGKDLELVFRGLMVLPWVEANHLIVRLQNIEKNERLNLEFEQKKAQQMAEPKPEFKPEPKVRKAKYGLKKDGTPRAKPGRKPA